MNQDSEELTQERASELVEKVAKWVVDRELEAPFIVLLGTFGPFSSVVAPLFMVFVEPFLAFLDPRATSEFRRFIQEPRNVEALLSRVEGLASERKKMKKSKQLARFRK